MGQHKYNPTAQAAKEGKLPPKPKKISKRERELQIDHIIWRIIGGDSIRSFLGGGFYG